MNAKELDKYYPLIHKICNKYPFKYREDLFNELYIACFDILERYDETQGTFQTFAYKRLDGAAKDYIKVNQLINRSLDAECYDEDGNTITYGDLLEGHDDFESELMYVDHIEHSERHLTSIEKFVRVCHRNGESPEQIAKKYYDYHKIKSPKTIRTIINK